MRGDGFAVNSVAAGTADKGRLPNFDKTIYLPPLKSFVDEQVSKRGYGTSSEYARELIRKDQDRLQLRGLLLTGAATVPAAQGTQARQIELVRVVLHGQRDIPA